MKSLLGVVDNRASAEVLAMPAGKIVRSVDLLQDVPVNCSTKRTAKLMRPWIDEAESL